ncbi:helix-turn-helix domain-containing protein [Pedobacter sp. AW31-3R]|uniref:helix-turn-helix domain-containing protein n=1 Tax=Pedobacter sp. AW31-3R TaxID=3445781 RepID=UPI003FA01172
MQEILSKKSLGERIKSLRIEKSLAQADVAKLLNLSRSNYSQIELGNQYPTFNTLCILSKHYEKSYNWLLHGEEDMKSKDAEHTGIPTLITELELTLQSFSASLKALENELQEIKNKIQVIYN